MNEEQPQPAAADEPRNSAGFWNEMIGPFYTPDGVMKILHVNEHELRVLVRNDQVLELDTPSGDKVYPSFQFASEPRAPAPRLSELLANLRGWPEESWHIALAVNKRHKVWGGRSMIDLLRTEWAGEMILQAAADVYRPLEERWLNERHMVVARPIFNRFMELIAGLPVDVDPGTLFVTRQHEPPMGVFLVSFRRGPEGLSVMNFGLDDDPEEMAQQMARKVRDAV